MEETGSMAAVELMMEALDRFHLKFFFCFSRVRILVVVEILPFALRVSSLAYGMDHWELFSIVHKSRSNFLKIYCPIL